ncbi:MAG: tetratricopeptide repeat protein [Sphingobacteriales bacterium]
MRIMLFFLFIALISKPVFCQVPSKTEMQNQMARAIKELNTQIADLEKQITEAKKNKEDDTTIKQLEDQLKLLKKQVEMMGGVSKGISNISDKTFKQAAENKNSEIPKRDITRINTLPKKILNDNELFSFMKKTTLEVEGKLETEEKKLGIQLYDSLISRKYSPHALGQYAFACMASGYPEMGLYIYGKACLADMTDADNLNNYAACLTMAGGEQYSLPILENLNSKYHFNSTILNNIGQAWFGLGDMNNAKLYLDSTVKIYSLHSEANQTLCLIQESEGNTEQAIESLEKSMESAYSNEKKSRLEKLGVKDVCKHLTPKYTHPIDPLGVYKYINMIPPIPLNLNEVESYHDQWASFREAIGIQIDKLTPQIANLENMEKDWFSKWGNKAVSPLKKQALLRPYANPVYYTANCKFLDYLSSEEPAMKKLAEHYSNAVLITDSLIGFFQSKAAKVEKCSAKNAINNELISIINPIWQDYKLEFLKLKKRFFNDALIHQMYSRPLPPNLWEMELTKYKIDFLSELRGISFVEILPCIEEGKTEEDIMPMQLPDFDDLHCNYVTDIWIPGWRYTIKCNKMTTECDLVIIRGNMEENLRTGKIIKGHADIGVSKSLGTKHVGPVSAEVKLEAGVFVEWGNDGVSDVGGSAGIKSELGFTTPHEMEEMIEVHTEKAGKIAFGSYPSVDVLSAEVKIGVTSGFHSEMKGLLMGHH